MNLSLPIGILGQVWPLIVSIPDRGTLTYLDTLYDRPNVILNALIRGKTLKRVLITVEAKVLICIIYIYLMGLCLLVIKKRS